MADPRPGEAWVLLKHIEVFARGSLRPLSILAGTPILILEELERFVPDVGCYRFLVRDVVVDAYIDRKTIVPLDLYEPPESHAKPGQA